MNQLRSNELVDVCAVVVRYFGGTKLGKSGLIEAYGQSISLAIETAQLLEIKKIQFVQIVYPYSQENTINKLILDYELEEQEAEYLANVSKLFACPVKNISTFKASLEALEHLAITHKMLHKSYIYG